MQKKFFISLLSFTLFLAVTGDAFANGDPLIYANNLEYLGAFRVPQGDLGGPLYHGLSYGGSVLTFNPNGNGGAGSLFIVGHDQDQLVAEISIPNPVNSSTISNLNIASPLQNLFDITDGNIKNIANGGTTISGTAAKIGGLLMVNNEKLIGTSYAFYSTLAALSHFTSGLNLSTIGDFGGMFQVGSSSLASFVSGYMTHVPSELQSSLGNALTGQGGLSIIDRTSYGPCAFSFDPAQVGVTDPVSVTPLLYYTKLHSTLNALNNGASQSPYFNWTTKIAGMTMISGSRSVLYFGYHGVGNYAYGNWTSDPNLIGTYCNNDGAICYYDPTGIGAKGPNAYPYVYQVWAYDANDLGHVKNGDIIGSERSANIDSTCTDGTVYQPWCIRPYAIWTLPYQFSPSAVFAGATAYDPVSQRLYISQPGADKVGCCSKLPLIHVFHVDFNNVPALSYKVGGYAILLNGSVTLQLNGTNDLVITSNDRKITQVFSFANRIATGSNYNVTIANQPQGQTCTVLNGSGIINANANISNIVVTCDNNSDVSAPAAPSGLNVQ